MSTTAELPSPWTCPTCRETGTDRHDLARKCRCPKMPASPALSPSLAEAAAPMLDRLSEIELAAELPVVPDALTVSVPVGQLRALRAALAVEEWRGKLRREAARMWLAASRGPGADGGPQRILLPAALKALDNWASDEARRAP